MIIRPPKPLPKEGVIIFLAGSIDMGSAVDWQKGIEKYCEKLGYIVANPRRPKWDTTTNPIASNPLFNEQVNWELGAIDRANIVFFYFAANSKAPITLLELGYVIGSGKKAIICCDPKYERIGNVEIMCKLYYYEEISFHTDLNEALQNLAQLQLEDF